MTVFLRVLEPTVAKKQNALLGAVCALRNSGEQPGVVFERNVETFAAIPGSPFAYWVLVSAQAAFSQFAAFGSQDRTALVGLQTSDDFRFLRAWWETAPDRLGHRWFGFAKGGSYSPFYADLTLLVGYSEGDQVGLQEIGRYGRGATHYFHPGLTWPLRTNGLSFRVMPSGCIFGHKGPAAFIDSDPPGALLSLLAILNSRPFGYLVSAQLARTELAQSYEVGLIQQTPLPTISAESTTALAQIACRAWSLKRSLDTGNETSHAFQLPPGVNATVTAIDAAAVERDLADIQAQIDDLTFSSYGISAEDRATIEAPTKGATSEPDDVDAEFDDAVEGDDDTGVSDASEALGSWLVGVVFGRFDPRLATGERAIPPEPEPFDPLPSRSPGMYPEGEEPSDRPDILVDDEGHADDLAARAVSVAERVKVDAPENLRAWLAKEFFPLHIKMYSKSRRKAPIYWQLATASAGYSVWLYIHAFSKDTLFRVQTDYVAPKLAHEERRLESLTSELREGATAAQRKQLAAQESLVEELRGFLDEVKRVAPLWKPNLDDGVVINFAPLWRLVPQNKAWQKELKSTWDTLCEGKYDWAHLAMHLWAERVVPKCAKDRSLAIAHGLEEVFWVEGTNGKWTARMTPTRSVDELVKERTSPAVKAALKSLLEAPVASGAAKKTRKGKASA